MLHTEKRTRNLYILRLACWFLAALLLLGGLVLPAGGVSAKAAEALTSIGLAEHAWKAYREGWQYVYGGKGNFNSSGVRTSDCSGLIYSYLCWVDDNSNIKDNYSMPRGVNSQVNASSVHGDVSSIPRTHGLIVTVAGNGHVGVYVGNGMVIDNSTWGVNMRYGSVTTHGWAQWHKLDALTYPTTGWYLFDGHAYYYENGEYIINTTRTFDGEEYTFGSDGISDKMPPSLQNSGYAVATSGMNARITGAGVRLREGPGTDSDVVTLLQKGTGVNVTSTKNKDWYAVTTGAGQKGYVSSKYIELTGEVPEDGDSGEEAEPTPKPEATPEPESTEKSDSGEVAKTTTAVHLRSGRGTSYSSLGVVAKGTSVTVTDTSDKTWYGVTVGKKSGYMHSDYIKLDSSASSSGSTEKTDTASDDKISTAAKTTTAVNLRSGRGTSYNSLGVIAAGTSVTVTDTSDKTWYGVTAGKQSGYMYSDYIKLDSGSAEKTDTTGGDETSTAAKTTAAVHLRSGRGTNYSSLGVIASGTSVTVTDTSDKTWYGVTVGKKSGYMFSEYLQTSDTGSKEKTVKTTAYLNLRSGAGTTKSVLTVIPQGATVTVQDTSNKAWYKVTYSGKTGYASTEYLK